MAHTTFNTLLDNIVPTRALGANYTAGSGTMVMDSGFGSKISSAITTLYNSLGYTVPTPVVGINNPLRFTVIKADAIEANGLITDTTKLTIFKATGISGDSLTGVVANGGTPDQNFSLGDFWRCFPTASDVLQVQNSIKATQDAVATAQSDITTLQGEVASASVLRVGSGATPITGGSDGGVLLQGTGAVLAESANLTYDSNGFRVGGGTGDLVPILASNTGTPPFVASESTQLYGNVAANAFSRSTGKGWIAAVNVGWIQIDLSQAGICNSYIMTGFNLVLVGSASMAPKSWVFAGSNDNSTWYPLDTQTNVSAWTSLESRTFALPGTTAYRYYRLTISENQGGPYASLNTLRLIGPIPLLLVSANRGLVSSTSFECNQATVTGLTVSGTSLITSPNRELVFEQTGDDHGTTRLHILNRDYYGGALFENTGIDLLDFIFKTSSGAFSNLRFEKRGYCADPANSTLGAFQFLTNSAQQNALEVGVYSVVVGCPTSAEPSGATFAVGTAPLPSTKVTVRPNLPTETILATVATTSQTGPHYAFYGISSTSTVRQQAQIDATWVNSNDSVRAGQIAISAFDYTGAREGIRIASDGTKTLIGMFGATPVGQQAGGAATASGTYGSTEQTMLQKVYDSLRAFGLLS